jgi:outer membrane protein TolC
MRKSKLLFVLGIFMMVNKAVFSQESIVPDISEVYLQKLISIAEANYPHIKANQNRINVAQSEIGKAKASYFDAFTFSYVYQPQVYSSISLSNQTTTTTNPSQSYYNGLQVGLFFNLGNFLEKPFAVKEARQNLEIANYDQQEYYLTLMNNVKKRYYTYVQGVAILKLQNQNCIDAQSLSTDIKHKFEKGEETFDNYTKAQTALTAAYQAKIAAETSLLISKSDLEELLGEKLENIQ